MERFITEVDESHFLLGYGLVWYTGSKELVHEIVEAGYYFSVNPTMLRTSKGKGILKEKPLNRILIETDGPFSKFNSNIAEPMHLKMIYETFEDF